MIKTLDLLLYSIKYDYIRWHVAINESLEIMKNFKSLLSLLAILSYSLTAFAQLTVKPTATNAISYMYVGDTFVYVDDEINLTRNPGSAGTLVRNANIALRNGGQLLQRNSGNTGTGELSLYQRGTVDNAFSYNFWCSPVGLTNTATGNGAFAYRPPNGGTPGEDQILFRPLTDLISQQAFIRFNSAGFQGITTGSTLQVETRWIFSLVRQPDYSGWLQIGNFGEIPAGLGFTMKGVQRQGNDNTMIDGEPNNNGGGQRYDFRGRPNSGTITPQISGGEYTLIGNPYPSALDLSAFLLRNSSGGTGTFTTPTINGGTQSQSRLNRTTGVAHFWEGNQTSHFVADYIGGYGTFSPMLSVGAGVNVRATFFSYDAAGNQVAPTGAMGAILDRRFSPIGQGFMIEGRPGINGNCIFDTNMRIYVPQGTSSSVFRASKEETAPVPGQGIGAHYPDVNNMPRDFALIKIGINMNDTHTRELAVGLHPLATDGHDMGGDAKLTANPTDVTFVVDDNKGFVINAAPQDEYQSLPITLDAAIPSEFRFSVHQTENFDYNNVYLYDSLRDTYHDILKGSAVVRLRAGEFAGRYFIRFTKESEPIVTNDDTITQDDITTDNDIAIGDDVQSVEQTIFETGLLESLSVYQNNTTQSLEIHNPNGEILKDMNLHDIAGKLIISKENLGSQSTYSFPTDNLSTGVYIVQFSTVEGFSKTQKVRIAN